MALEVDAYGQPGDMTGVGLYVHGQGGGSAPKALWAEAYAPLTNMTADTHAEVSEGEYLTDMLTMHATYEGEYMGQAISGVPVTFNQAETMRIVDGKIVEWWVVFDQLWLSEQLGFELKRQ